MKAIEFVTTTKQGKMIEIPKEYINEVSGEFRVILLLNTESVPKVTRKRTFKALKLKTKGFNFNRNYIYNEHVVENSLNIVNPFK